MAVSKIAVMALVAVIAVPILLGYAFNLSETTESGYKVTGESVNVTPLLQNGTGYTYTHTDFYKLNTDMYLGNAKIIPRYNKISSASSSYPLGQAIYYNQSWSGASQGIGQKYFYEEFIFDPATNSFTTGIYGTVGGVETLLRTITNLHTFYYDRDTGKYEYSYYTSPLSLLYGSGTGDLTRMEFTTVTGNVQVVKVAAYDPLRFADFSAGFYMDLESSISYVNYINTPLSKSILFTVNLDSITNATYELDFYIGNHFKLVKTTDVGGNVNWKLQEYSDPSNSIDLFYDPSRSDNTYQFNAIVEKTTESNTTKYYDLNIEAYYVGGWPTVIGKANYYNSAVLETDYTTLISVPDYTFDKITLVTSTNNKTPTMRLDDALSKSYEYPIIANQSYTPSNYKNNPATTITNITKYGQSLEFGGNTYNVADGKITLNGHNIPVNDLVFLSVPNDGGTYDNKIGNTLISTSAAPSTIKFNGNWSANVSTQSMESYTYSKTEWHVGEFGWDGVDQNFPIVGLITCLGTFVALGIYARKSRSGGVIPLMIVTGCAAMVFFIML